MLITRFNKMIRNRLLWAFFAIVVTIAFVGSYAISGSGDRDERSVEGVVFGETISRDEFRFARACEMRLRVPRDLTSEEEALLRELTWNRVAMLHSTDAYGIRSTPGEVDAFVNRNPGFARDGAFNKELYQQRILTEYGLRHDYQYREFIRQSLAEEKSLLMLSWAAWVPSFEAAQGGEEATATYSVEVIDIPLEAYKQDVTVSSDDIERFFDEHKKEFAVPERVCVKYVAFPVTNYMADVSVMEEEVLEYYDEHLDDYREEGSTNEPPLKPTAVVALAITNQLLTEAATRVAKDEASDLAWSLVPDSEAITPPSFEEAAAAGSVQVYTSAFFGVEEAVPGLDVDDTFRRAAFKRTIGDANEYSSEPIVQADAVYVVAAHQRQAERDALLDEVRSEVQAAATEAARKDAFTVAVDMMRSNVVTALEDGAVLSNALSAVDLNVSTSVVFSGTQSYWDLPQSVILLRTEILASATGTLTRAVSTSNGAVMAYVLEKGEGDAMARQRYVQERRQQLTRLMTRNMYTDWRAYLKQQGKLDDLQATKKTAETADENSDS